MPRKLLALLSLALILTILLAPGTSGFLFIELSPIWLFFGLVLAFRISRQSENEHPQLFPLLDGLPSRAPPIS